MVTFDKFLQVMDTLLGENGCPWDREQTHESLRQYMLEECYEAVQAINDGDMVALREELGDVLLQVVFHAKLAEKAGKFDIGDVIEGVSQKLVSRHTHVFGEDIASDSSEVMKIWEANKQKESAGTVEDSMRAVPLALPALVRASKVVKRSGKELPSAEELICEITKMFTQTDTLREDFGKILLAIVSLSNVLFINAENSLTNAVEAFINTDSPVDTLGN